MLPVLIRLLKAERKDAPMLSGVTNQLLNYLTVKHTGKKKLNNLCLKYLNVIL